MRSLSGAVGAVVGVAVATLGLVTPAAAAPAYPAAEGRCVDQVGVLGSQVCAKVTRVLMPEEKATSDEIAVAVVPSTGDQTIEGFGTGLFNTWGVGKKHKNNGILLVVAVDDRSLRLVTGRGMATRLSDEAAGEIVDTVITPQFAHRHYALGILAGLDEVRRKIGHTVTAGAQLESLADEAPDTTSQSSGETQNDSAVTGQDSIGGSSLIGGDQLADGDVPQGDDDLPFGAFVVGGIVLMGLIAVVRGLASGNESDPDRRAGRWSTSGSGWRSTGHSTWTTNTTSDSSSNSLSDSGSAGGSSSSFGGGSSDGGGASGSW